MSAVFGRVVKPNGLNGELIVKLNDSSETLPALGGFVFMALRGSKVPFEIIDAKDRGAPFFLLKFKFVDTSEEAAKFIGAEFFKDPKSESDELEPEWNLDDLVGWTAVDTNLGRLGKISEVVHHSHQSLIEIQDEHRVFLVPLVEEFLIGMNEAERVLLVEIPDGLLNLGSP